MSWGTKNDNYFGQKGLLELLFLLTERVFHISISFRLFTDIMFLSFLYLYVVKVYSTVGVVERSVYNYTS